MRLLALDMSVHVGFVAFDGPGALAAIGTWDLQPRARLGDRFRLFHDWLTARCEQWQPQLLAFEEPIRGVPWRRSGTEHVTNMTTQKLLQGMAAIAELVAAECGIERDVIEVVTSSAKKKLAGSGRADKLAMIRAARAMGIHVTDDHQADALGVALCAYEHCGVDVRGHGGPLLATLSRW